MPKKPEPLPPELRGRQFSPAHARAAGLNRWRAERKDVVRVRYGVLAGRGTEIGEFETLAVLLGEREKAFLSHVTAAMIYGVPVPRRLEGQQHITQPRGTKAPRLAGVVGHQRNVDEHEIRVHRGVRMSSPERLLFEMAQLLTANELIELGDALVRIPRQKFDKRSQPLTTLDRLAGMLELHEHSPGIRALRIAIPQIRVGADSPMETRCRLAIVRAGLPEPELQVRLDRTNQYSLTADLGYDDLKIAVQYDGSNHFDSTAETQTRDSQRDAAFERAGWKVIRVNKMDAANGFQFLIAELRRLLV